MEYLLNQRKNKATRIRRFSSHNKIRQMVKRFSQRVQYLEILKTIDKSLISKINKKQSPLVYLKNHYLQKTLKFKQWMNSNNPQRQ